MRKLLRGSRLDELPIDQIDGTWRNARNIVTNKQLQSVTVEDGADNVTPIDNGVSIDFPFNKKVIGCIVLNVEKLFFFGTTNPSDSEIGIVDAEDNYRVILKGDPLNFNENFPIEGTYEIKFNGNLVIAWTDNYNKPRILNVDCIPFKVNTDGTIPLGEQAKANVLISLFPDFLTPIINRRKLIVEEGAGALLSGVYYPVISYGFEDGSFTNWSKIYNAIPIFVDDKNLSINEVGGCLGGLPTNKYIKIHFDNVDPNFKFLKIGYLYLKNGQTFAYEVKKYTINNATSLDIELLGNENTIVELALDEILVPNSVYERVKTLTNLEKVLHLGNLKEPDQINYQNYANEIVVEWTRGFKNDDPFGGNYLFMNFAQNVDYFGVSDKPGYKNETTVYFDKCFKSGECYALYIFFNLINGTRSKGFHIPGRDFIAGDRDVMNGTKVDINDLDGGNPVYRYQIYNTAQSNPTNPFEGIMGFWENENEEYPLNDDGTAIHPDYANIPGVTIGNRKVRHHVFPTLSKQVEAVQTYYASPGAPEFMFSAPNANYYRETRIQTSIAPSDPNYYHVFYNGLNGASGNPASFTYSSLAVPNRARFNAFGFTEIFKLKFGFNEDYSVGKVGQSVAALGGSWSIRINIQKNASVFVEHIIQIDNQTLTSSTVPTQAFTVDIPVTPGDTVDILYEIYTSLGTGSFSNPFTYTNFMATLEATMSDIYIIAKPLGIKISNVVIPPELIGLVDSWEIGYAKRSNENLRIVAQDMLKNERFHNFDLMTNKLPVKPSFLRPELNYNTPGVQIGNVPEYMAFSPLAENYEPDDLDSISKFLYVGENTTSPVNNGMKASSIYCVAGNGQINASFIQTKYGENNVLCDLVSYKRNMYKLFQDQEIFTTGMAYKILNSGLQYDETDLFGNPFTRLFGGDIHITPFGFRDVLNNAVIFNFLGEFASNVNLRRADDALGYTYFPKSGYPTASWYGYNKDFNCNNGFNLIDIHYPIKDCLDNIIYHPNRIARSIPETTESNKINWRTFKANSYYDTVRNKGEIWKLLGGNRTLYIALKYSLFTAQIKDKIAGTNGEVYLGYTDIFDRPPFEVLSTNEGYAGNQSQFATILCKIGYCFIDRNQGKVFVLNQNALQEISNEGLFNFFKDNSEYINKDIDNPFIGNGYTMAYDEQKNRLVITKNITESLDEGDIQFTWSFSPELKGWLCQHDYNPNFMFYNRSGFYAVDNSTGNPRLFKHNSKTKKAIFYDGLIKKSYVEFVENSAKDKTKGFENINWVTTVREGTTNFVKETITHLIVYNDSQCSGEITLSTEVGLWYNQDARNTQQTWNFNNFRDIVTNQDLPFIDIKNQLINSNLNTLKEWFEQSKFISKFVIVRLIHDNQNQKEVSISLVGTNAKISNR